MSIVVKGSVMVHLMLIVISQVDHICDGWAGTQWPKVLCLGSSNFFNKSPTSRPRVSLLDELNQFFVVLSSQISWRSSVSKFSSPAATLQVLLACITGSVPPTCRRDWISTINIFHRAELADPPVLAFPLGLIIDTKIVYCLWSNSINLTSASDISVWDVRTY